MQKKCPKCGRDITCPTCKGNGFITMKKSEMFNGKWIEFDKPEKCFSCNGSGTIKDHLCLPR